MLIDEYLPKYDVHEVHATVVRATVAETWAAIRTADLTGRLGGWVMAIRTLGATRPRARRTTVDTLIDERFFGLVAEAPPHELVLGIAGSFWQPRCRPAAADASAFGRPLAPNTALAAWNFSVEAIDDTHSRLRTETRVICSDPAARRKFLIYWTIIRPGSGLIRRVALRAIRRAAEKAASAG